MINIPFFRKKGFDDFLRDLNAAMSTITNAIRTLSPIKSTNTVVNDGSLDVSGQANLYELSDTVDLLLIKGGIPGQTVALRGKAGRDIVHSALLDCGGTNISQAAGQIYLFICVETTIAGESVFKKVI